MPRRKPISPDITLHCPCCALLWLCPLLSLSPLESHSAVTKWPLLNDLSLPLSFCLLAISEGWFLPEDTAYLAEALDASFHACRPIRSGGRGSLLLVLLATPRPSPFHSAASSIYPDPGSSCHQVICPPSSKNPVQSFFLVLHLPFGTSIYTVTTLTEFREAQTQRGFPIHHSLSFP